MSCLEHGNCELLGSFWGFYGNQTGTSGLLVPGHLGQSTNKWPIRAINLYGRVMVRVLFRFKYLSSKQFQQICL